MRLPRQRIEDVIERLIGILDELDGDPDVEPEPLEEQHDAEADQMDRASMGFVIAERRRRARKAS
jgi:hypothetical protein